MNYSDVDTPMFPVPTQPINTVSIMVIASGYGVNAQAYTAAYKAFVAGWEAAKGSGREPGVLR